MNRVSLAFLLILLTVTCAWAGATYTSPKFTATDSNGVPLSGGKLYTYKPGTTTDKATYSDKTLVTANTNPVVLDSRGEADVYGEGRYKFVLKDSSDTTIWTVDNVDGKGEKVLTSIGDYGDSLNTAIATIGATETTLVIDTDVTLTANATIPATMELFVTRSGQIILNGKTLVINGYIRAGPYQIFTIGAGTLTINTDFYEHDQWRDGAGDDWLPTNDDAVDLGDATHEFKDGYFDGTIYTDAISNSGSTTTSIVYITPETESFTTEGDMTLTNGIVLLSGDDDSDNDDIDLQDGTTGTILYLIAAANIDADDTVTIDTTTDSTCTNCPAIVFDTLGENAQLVWTGSTWVVISLQDSL